MIKVFLKVSLGLATLVYLICRLTWTFSGFSENAKLSEDPPGTPKTPEILETPAIGCADRLNYTVDEDPREIILQRRRQNLTAQCQQISDKRRNWFSPTSGFFRHLQVFYFF